MSRTKYDYEGTPLFFAKSSYRHTNGLAIECYTDEEGFIEPWSSVTVCLGEEPESPYHAFIDVNNNGTAFTAWLEKIGAGQRTGKLQKSGFVVYPYFCFDKSFVDCLPLMEKVEY